MPPPFPVRSLEQMRGSPDVHRDRKRCSGVACRVSAAGRSLAVMVVLSLQFLTLPALASTYIDVRDEIYPILSRLEADGVITTGLLTIRPISRKDAERLLREAEGNAQGRGAYIEGLVRDLKRRLGPEQTADAGTVHGAATVGYLQSDVPVLTRTDRLFGTREREQPLYENRDGDVLAQGGNVRTDVAVRLEDLGRFSFLLDPEVRWSGEEGGKTVLKSGYAVVDLGMDVVAGKDSQWWGPGYHGSLLLSNNAEALTMVKAVNAVPGELPWIFKHLGPYRLALFVSELREERADHSDPYVWGMRFVCKPFPFLELGLGRTAMLGGAGRPTDAGTWMDSLLGRNEHSGSETGDQRAGYDLKLTLPFDLQPIQVYWEEDGEDGRQRHGGLPYKNAVLAGVYLPRVLGYERIAMRMEYASDIVNGWTNVWYTHWLYTDGYTYKGSVIGHHMGTESRDLFAEVSYRFPEQGINIAVSYDRTAHRGSSSLQEIEREVQSTVSMSLAEAVDLRISSGYWWMVNANEISGSRVRGHLTDVSLSYRF